jgi:hypothetical protein
MVLPPHTHDRVLHHSNGEEACAATIIYLYLVPKISWRCCAIKSFMYCRLCIVANVMNTGSLALNKCHKYDRSHCWHVEQVHSGSMGMPCCRENLHLPDLRCESCLHGRAGCHVDLVGWDSTNLTCRCRCHVWLLPVCLVHQQCPAKVSWFVASVDSTFLFVMNGGVALLPAACVMLLPSADEIVIRHPKCCRCSTHLASIPGNKSIHYTHTDMLLLWEHYNSIMHLLLHNNIWCASYYGWSAAVDTTTDVSYREPQIAPFASALKTGVGGIMWACQFVIHWCNEACAGVTDVRKLR